jgi:hypothetical protein
MNLELKHCPICEKETQRNKHAIYCGTEGQLHYTYSFSHMNANIHIAEDLHLCYFTIGGFKTEILMPRPNGTGW